MSTEPESDQVEDLEVDAESADSVKGGRHTVHTGAKKQPDFLTGLHAEMIRD